MRKTILLLIIALFFGTFSAQSQVSLKEIPSFDDPMYNSYLNKNELWVCASTSSPLLLSVDVFGISYNVASGKFSRVTVGKPTEILEYDLGSLFNVIGMPSGVYEFIFEATTDICDMSVGQIAVVRVYLVPDLAPFNILRNICATDRVSINLLDFVPQDVHSFAEVVDWKFFFYDDEGNLIVDGQNNPTNILSNLSKDDLGTKMYSYAIDDSQGDFADKYNTMDPHYACDKKSDIGLTIKVKGADISIPDKDISYCFENVIKTTVNYPAFVISLKSLLEAEAPIDIDDRTQGWSWTNSNSQPTVPEFKHIVTAESADEFIEGNIIINTKIIDSLISKNKLALPLKLEFKYRYMGCESDDIFETKLVINFTDKMKDVVIDKSKSICRNLNASNLDIANYFGFNIPITAVSWSEIIGGDKRPMQTGIINLDTLKLGTEYTYSCYVSGALVDLCDLAGVDATFKLKVRDVEMQSAIATICQDAFDEGVKVNLFDHVMGLSNEAVVDPAEVKWCVYGNDPLACTEILNPKEYTMGLFNGVIPTFKFSYNSDCGESEGKLYMSVLDVIPVEEHHKEIVVCFTDDYASSINLFEVLGVMGLTGEFTSADVAKDGIIFDGKKFNASEAFTPDPSNIDHSETFLFEYEVVNGDCLSEKATVKVVVTQTKQ